MIKCACNNLPCNGTCKDKNFLVKHKSSPPRACTAAYGSRDEINRQVDYFDLKRLQRA